MKTIYDIFSALAKALLPLAGAFNKKLKLGVQGRERTWDILDQKVKSSIPKIWVHASSLGEFEQVVPILEKIDRAAYQVVLSFFSPSGYENKKNTHLADVVCYLPIDAVSNVNKFIAKVDPSIAIMVKYEFWPNYLNALRVTQCKTILVSGIFRAKMPFNSWYGTWMTRSLESFDYFFLQNTSSLHHLEQLGYTNASVSGDTRFDRASQLIERDSTVKEIEDFIGTKKCLVIGSSWPEDIAIMINWLKKNNTNTTYKVIIAPHEVKETSIRKLEKTLNFPCVKWSDIQSKETEKLSASSTLIINNIGLLTKVYSYADLAYVGGAMGTKGLHNILEAATYGVPIMIGKNYEKFPEAGKLEDLGGLFSVKNALEFESMTDQLLEGDYLRDKTGMICGHWINSNSGATREIADYLKTIDEKLILD